MDWIQSLLIPLVYSVVLVVVLLSGFAYLSLAERKLVARFTQRFGPNRAGPFGLLQPISDALKMMFKEELMPTHADKVVYLIAPMLAVSTAMMTWAVFPILSQSLQVFGYTIPSVLADVNVGILYISAITGIASYAVVLAGWSSNNKYSLLGALRGAAQMVSYELPFGLAIVAVVLVTGTLNMTEIIGYQISHVWLMVSQPVAFIIFIIAGLAEINRSPFDLPETENELVSGFMTEYGAIRFASFAMAEYIHVITFAALSAILFMGGWSGPGAASAPLLGLLYFIIKIVIMIFLVILIRSGVPRVRYDQLMRFCWKFLMPLALLNVAVTAVVIAL